MGQHILLNAKIAGVQRSAVDMANNELPMICVIPFCFQKQLSLFQPLKKPLGSHLLKDQQLSHWLKPLE
jgi:hypothetical protein